MQYVSNEELEAEMHARIAAGQLVHAYAYAAELDRRILGRPKPSLSGSAQWYAEQGLHVFPLQPGSKMPWRGSRGFKDATTDPRQIRAWWEKLPAANIGIATGHLVDVIDIDGPEGVKSWAGLDHLPPQVGRVNTPRPGGTHLYITATGEGNGAKLFPGIDYRGLGGYVVAPPSTNADGKAYRWTIPLTLERP